MSFGLWSILDTHRKLLSGKNPAALQFDTLKPVRLVPTTIPRSKAFEHLNISVEYIQISIKLFGKSIPSVYVRTSLSVDKILQTASSQVDWSRKSEKQ